MQTLIVEDNSLFRRFLVELLRRHFPGMRVAEADDWEQAWREVESRSPDLVFMDLRLTASSGLELTRAIKRNHPEVVVIVLTGFDLPEYQEAALANGASFFLAKGRTSPTDILSLVSSLQH